MITSDRVAAIDRNAEALGVPRKQLMESSGNAVARAVREHAAPDDRITILAGRGNNGGDAFVAVRFLDDFDVTVGLLGRPQTIRSTIAQENWTALQHGAYDTAQIRDSTALTEGAIGHRLDSSDVIVDALLGTGISGSLREPTATAVTRINAADATVISVDVPSGVDPDTGERTTPAVQADHVVTFHEMKPGLTDLTGTVTVADIGIPDAAQRFVGPGDLLALGRQSDAHKGDHGEILVIGGGPYTGAPALTGLAALRAGGDLVRIACPEAVADTIQGYAPDLIVRSLPGQRLDTEHVDRLLDLAAEHDSVVVGPGLGRHKETLAAVRSFLEQAVGEIVVDADPLRIVPDIETAATLVCTPHQGELDAMGGPVADDWEQRERVVSDFATEIGHTLLVKGAYDIISDGEQTRVNRTGNPGMTVGGTGDVLAGVTGAMLAVQPPVAAGATAAYATGKAGDQAAEEDGYGLVASDLPAIVPEIIWGETDG